MGAFDGAIGAIQERLGTLSGGSPFGGSPFTNANPGFTGVSGGTPFKNNPFATTGSPFGNPFGGGGSPFGNPFGSGGGSPFGNPFGGGGGSPFGNPFGQGTIANPFNGSASDPFGTGKGAAPTKSNGSSSTTFFGGGEWTPSTLDGAGAQKWLLGQRADSPLVGIAPDIVAYARSKGVDPGMLFGVLKSESQFASDGAMGTRQNNPGNIMAPGADPANGKIILRSYSTLLDGVKAMVDLFASYGQQYGATTTEAQIATYYVGPEAYKKYGLQANDAGGAGAGGNGTVQDYLEKKVYPTMQAFGATRLATSGSTNGVRNANWEQTALAYTKSGGKWVDYTNGGIRITGNPADGMDCSSFTGYVLGLDKGIWNAQAQADASQKFTDIKQAKKGDLIFFQGTTNDDPSARPVTHVSIYLGDGKMIHTGSVGRGVEIIDVSAMQQYFYAFGRI